MSEPFDPSKPLPAAPYSVKKALTKAAVGTSAVTMLTTFTGWMSQIALAWLKYFNDHSEHYVIRLPQEWATDAGMTAVLIAILAVVQDRLAYLGYWPKVLS